MSDAEKTPPSSKKTPEEETVAPKDVSPKPRKELHVVSIPQEDELMAEEMAELFDEDRVTHRHGNSEPEKD